MKYLLILTVHNPNTAQTVHKMVTLYPSLPVRTNYAQTCISKSRHIIQNASIFNKNLFTQLFIAMEFAPILNKSLIVVISSFLSATQGYFLTDQSPIRLRLLVKLIENHQFAIQSFFSVHHLSKGNWHTFPPHFRASPHPYNATRSAWSERCQSHR